jgi:hypothetical protein
MEGNPGTCATLSIKGHPKQWLQIADDTVNAAYPSEVDPESLLKLLPEVSGLSVSEWEPGRFCTVRAEDLGDPALPAWIDAYFVAVFNARAGEYLLELRIEEL